MLHPRFTHCFTRLEALFTLCFARISQPRGVPRGPVATLSARAPCGAMGPLVGNPWSFPTEGLLQKVRSSRNLPLSAIVSFSRPVEHLAWKIKFSGLVLARNRNGQPETILSGLRGW